MVCSRVLFYNASLFYKLFAFQCQKFYVIFQKVKLPYFKLPSMQSGFRNIVYDRKWKSDQVFVEQRLAGLNPMALQKVSLTGA